MIYDKEVSDLRDEIYKLKQGLNARVIKIMTLKIFREERKEELINDFINNLFTKEMKETYVEKKIAQNSADILKNLKQLNELIKHMGEQ